MDELNYVKMICDAFELDYHGIRSADNLMDKTKPWAMRIRNDKDRQEFLRRVAKSNRHDGIPIDYFTIFDHVQED
jgi:hypothetical protein